MAIIHTEKVKELYILENNSDNIVAKVEINISSVDDSNSDTVTSQDLVEIDTSGGKEASGFIAYESLTENDVLEWVETKRNVLKTINTYRLTNQKVIQKNLPW